MSKRIRIVAYQITPLVYEDDGEQMVRLKTAPTEVPAAEIALYLAGVQREAAALEQKSNEEK